jgi:NAD dependent epimerase/dehydratase family enzyme
VLVLGGCGFIGRHLVSLLRDRRLTSRITVADKALPATSHLNAQHQSCYEDKALVVFKHADLAKPDHVARVFKDAKFDYVFNLCGETRFGLSDKVSLCRRGVQLPLARLAFATPCDPRLPAHALACTLRTVRVRIARTIK